MAAAFPRLVDYLGSRELKDRFMTGSVFVEQGWGAHINEKTGRVLMMVDLQPSSHVVAPVPSFLGSPTASMSP